SSGAGGTRRIVRRWIPSFTLRLCHGEDAISSRGGNERSWPRRQPKGAALRVDRRAQTGSMSGNESCPARLAQALVIVGVDVDVIVDVAVVVERGRGRRRNRRRGASRSSVGRRLLPTRCQGDGPASGGRSF